MARNCRIQRAAVDPGYAKALLGEPLEILVEGTARDRVDFPLDQTAILGVGSRALSPGPGMPSVVVEAMHQVPQRERHRTAEQVGLVPGTGGDSPAFSMMRSCGIASVTPPLRNSLWISAGIDMTSLLWRKELTGRNVAGGGGPPGLCRDAVVVSGRGSSRSRRQGPARMTRDRSDTQARSRREPAGRSRHVVEGGLVASSCHRPLSKSLPIRRQNPSRPPEKNRDCYAVSCVRLIGVRSGGRWKWSKICVSLNDVMHHPRG